MNNYVMSSELTHHGVLGMKWGIRRYQPYGTAYDAEHKGKFVGERKRGTGDGSKGAKVSAGLKNHAGTIRKPANAKQLPRKQKNADQPKEVTVDLTGAKTKQEVHDRVKKSVNVPDHYGNNLDALNDVATEQGITKINIKGKDSLSGEMKDYADKMQKLSDDLQADSKGDDTIKNVASLTDKEKTTHSENRAKEFLKAYKEYDEALGKLFEKDGLENFDDQELELRKKMLDPIVSKLEKEGYEVFEGGGRDDGIDYLDVQLFADGKNYFGRLDSNGEFDFYEEDELEYSDIKDKTKYVIANDELFHHGVLGMKWGVRRYQSYEENPKLSDRQKKKLNRKYEKLTNKAYKRNKKEIANEMNRRVNEHFSKQETIDKYRSYAESGLSENTLEMLYDSEVQSYMQENMSEVAHKMIQNDKAYKEAEELAKQYGMAEWSEAYKKVHGHEEKKKQEEAKKQEEQRKTFELQKQREKKIETKKNEERKEIEAQKEKTMKEYNKYLSKNEADLKEGKEGLEKFRNGDYDTPFVRELLKDKGVDPSTVDFSNPNSVGRDVISDAKHRYNYNVKDCPENIGVFKQLVNEANDYYDEKFKEIDKKTYYDWELD